MTRLDIQNIHIQVDDTVIIEDLSLSLEKGETLAIMGPNGSGKSTLANTLMGHPDYEAQGEAFLDGENILDMEPDERSQAGVFLSFQYPVDIPGVTVSNFIRTAINARRQEDDPIKIPVYVKKLNEMMSLLDIPKEFSKRYLNEGFSGGERKKMEILQLAMLEPKLAILDETDSGLDVDALKDVAKGLQKLQDINPDLTYLIITHYERLLTHIEPDTVCIMKDGEVTAKGGPEIAQKLEKEGYEAFN